MEKAKLTGSCSHTWQCHTFNRNFLIWQKEDKKRLFSLPFRVENRKLPSVEIVNMSEELKEGNKIRFSAIPFREPYGSVLIGMKR
jgi:primosomal protein N'